MTTSEPVPLPIPPFFVVPNINNLRDPALYPGGLRTPTGQKVRPGILFRSAEVSQLDQAGWAAVRSIGVKAVFDLRSKPEVLKGWRGVIKAKTGLDGKEIGEEVGEDGVTKDGMGVRDGWLAMMENEGLERVWCPVFKDDDYSPERLAERYMKYMGEDVEVGRTCSFVPDHTGAFGGEPERSGRLGRGSTQIPPLGALIHCTAGKDRTGIFFGLILDFLGVPRDLIATDYNLTELGLLPMREKLVNKLMQSTGFRKLTLSQVNGTGMTKAELAALLAKREGAADAAEEEEEEEEEVIPPDAMKKSRAAALRMIGAKKESMIAALEMLDREWGGAEGYMRSVCGLGDNEIEALRTTLLVPGDDVPAGVGRGQPAL
ncbi:hypothetical protein K432DRAFT_318715 [Lepidopterella palustris CBS 459.81]|uniref:Tyrosine specific protein phosphatases domain-containing protein n=1 Tax=Lepidopterella palustris CBS 459.81 TaxID=1314670 RepID=A0A8E2EJM3_9PEZI|nr:hypothetical protein K432DRAFT_318715 [Lepidopterella palustris CBS 459.81]